MILFGWHQISQYLLGCKFLFFDNYLDPILSIPCLLGLVLQERRFLLFFLDKQKGKNYRFSLFEVIVITLFLSILFEEGFPRWSKSFTKDYWDYIAYFLGGAIFYFFINKNEANKKPIPNTRDGQNAYSNSKI